VIREGDDWSFRRSDHAGLTIVIAENPIRRLIKYRDSSGREYRPLIVLLAYRQSLEEISGE